MRKLLCVLIVGVGCVVVRAQTPQRPAVPAPQVGPQSNRDPLNPAPRRRADEGRGPFKSLVVRGAILIDGTGAPPVGPVDIVIEGNRIQAVRSAGTPGLPPRTNRAPQNADLEVDATGMYVMPGFVSLHEHAGGAPKNPDIEYPYKLWLAHGYTTVRGVPLTDHALAVTERERSNRNEIVAPRIVNFQRPGAGWGKGVPDTPEDAREWVRWGAANGLDGLKLGAQRPDIMAALLDEAKKLEIGSTAHLQQTGVAQMNALDGRKARTQDGHALLRTLRGAPQGLRCPAVARRSESTTTSRCGSDRSPGYGTRSTRQAATSGRRISRSIASSAQRSTRP